MKAVDPVTSERVEYEVHSRKIEFSNLRQFTLKRHQKYLRVPDTKYVDLDKKQILSMLENYGDTLLWAKDQLLILFLKHEYGMGVTCSTFSSLVASFARLSASSFPATPVWPLTQ